MSGEEMEDWTAKHFSLADRGGDVAALLRRVAETVASSSPIEVQDITFHQELNTDEDGDPFIPVVSMTVYYHRREDEHDGEG